MKIKHRDLLGNLGLFIGAFLIMCISGNTALATSQFTSVTNRWTQISYSLLSEYSKSSVSPAYKGTGQRAAKILKASPATFSFDPTGAYNTESVIGSDGRKRVISTATYPNSALVYLEIKFPGYMANCTGWFVGPRTVVTAGHCVYDVDLHKWAISATVYPGRNGSSLPFGKTTGNRFFSMTGWTRDMDANFDLGAIQTQAPLGDSTGWLGYSWQAGKAYEGSFQINGYPDDKPKATLWGMYGGIAHINKYRLWHLIDTRAGESGSPLFHRFNGECCYAVGVHTNGISVPPYFGNSATRINRDFYDNLNRWKSAIYP